MNRETKINVLGLLIVTGLVFVLCALDVAAKYAYMPVARHGTFAILAVSVYRGAMVSSLLLGAAFVLRRFSALFLSLAFVFVYVIVTAELISQCTFHMGLGGEWYFLLMQSSSKELTEFAMLYLKPLNVLLSVVWLVILVAVEVVVFKWASTRKAIPKRPIAMAIGLILGLGAIFGMYRFNVGQQASVLEFWSATQKCRSSYLKLAECRNPRLPDRVYADGPVLGVVIVGESSARSHWGLYGYSRDTTPRLSAVRDDLLVFKDVRAPSTLTGMVLRYLFTAATKEKPDDIRYTLSALCKKAGYRSILVSNQGHWGGRESVEELMFYSCDEKKFVADLKLPPPVYDDAIFPLLDQWLDGCRAASNAVAFLHVQGSHSPADARYPKSFAVFKEDLRDKASEKIVGRDHLANFNQYDNSIVYTDYFCSEIVDRVKALHRPSFVLYVSDHGESPSSPSWRTVTDEDCWEVPMFVWLSPEYKRTYNEGVAEIGKLRPSHIESDVVKKTMENLMRLNIL